MSTEISSPLADIVKRMAQQPAQGRVEAVKRRFTEATEEVCLLVDVSSSMTDFVGNVSQTKYDAAIYAVRDVQKYFPKIRIIAFGLTGFKQVGEVKDIRKFPPPCGGTPLAEAIEYAAKYKPRKTIVICDGDPNNRQAAEEEAQKITGSIDIIYCGPEGTPSHDWLNGLAKKNYGQAVAWNGAGELATTIRLRIEAPKP